MSESSTESGTGMTHDPLCPFWPQSADASCLWCDLIAKVREDEHDCDKHGDDIRYRCSHYQQGRRDMLEKCIALVEQGHPRGVRWWADWLFWSKFRRRLVTFGYDWHKKDALELLHSKGGKPWAMSQ